MSNDDLNTKTTELKESILTQVETILTESKDVEFNNKLNSVKNEVQSMDTSKINYYRLTELKNGLN